MHSQKIPESQTNEKIDKPTRKDKDRDEKDSDKEMETMTQKLHTEPPKHSTSKKINNYNAERQREPKTLEEKKRKRDASNDFEKDNSKYKKSREETNTQPNYEKLKAKKTHKDTSPKHRKLYYDSSTSEDEDDDKHTLEENTPTRPLSNTKNLQRTNSVSSQRSDDYSDEQNRDVHRFCTYIFSIFTHTTC